MKKETDENGEWDVEENTFSTIRLLTVPNETFKEKQSKADKVKISASLPQLLYSKGIISKKELDDIEPKKEVV